MAGLLPKYKTNSNGAVTEYRYGFLSIEVNNICVEKVDIPNLNASLCICFLLIRYVGYGFH